MADGEPRSWSNDSLKGQILIVIASLQKSVPYKLSQFSENFIDEEILDRFIIENISEDEETWLQTEFDGVESLETENVETWLKKVSPKPTFILSSNSNSNSSYVSGIGKHTSPYLTFVRPKRPNIDTSRLTFLPNISDHNVTGDGVPNLDHESDSSMASSLLLDSHVAHLDKTGVLNFDDQTESESLQNCLSQTSTWESTMKESVRAENQTISFKPPSEPVRKSFVPPIMGRSYTKLPYQQVRYDPPHFTDNHLSDSLEDLNFNPRSSPEKQSEFDSRTYRKSAIKQRERLIMSSERNGSPFSILSNGNMLNSTALANNNASNSNTDQVVFKTPINFDSSTFSRSHVKNRKSAVPFSGFQIKNAALFQSESPGVFETFTIAKQNNGVINIEPEDLENSLDYISNVQTPSFANFDLDPNQSQDSPFNSSHNLNSTVVIDKMTVGDIENGLADFNNDVAVNNDTFDNDHDDAHDDVHDDNSVIQFSLNQTYDANQNISSALHLPAVSQTLNSTFEIADEKSYIRKTPKLVHRLSVSQGDGLEKIELPNKESRRSFSDHKPAIPRGPLKNSKLSLPVRRTLYSSNTNIQKQVEAEEPNIIHSQNAYNKSVSNLRETNFKSGLRRPVSAMERCSEVKYYNLTDKKNVLNSTFCKSATNLSASYIVEKHSSVEDVSRGSVDSSSSSSILSSSSYTCISASNGTINFGQVTDPPVDLKKGNDHLFSPPKSSSTPKNNATRSNLHSHEVVPSLTQTDVQEDQLNFQPFPNPQVQGNQRLDETLLLSDSPIQNRVMDETLIIKPQRSSGLRMPSVRPAPSRLPTAAPTSSIPRFASKLPTFTRMRIPAPVKK